MEDQFLATIIVSRTTVSRTAELRIQEVRSEIMHHKHPLLRRAREDLQRRQHRLLRQSQRLHLLLKAIPRARMVRVNPILINLITNQIMMISARDQKDAAIQRAHLQIMDGRKVVDPVMGILETQVVDITKE